MFRGVYLHPLGTSISKPDRFTDNFNIARSRRERCGASFLRFALRYGLSNGGFQLENALRKFGGVYINTEIKRCVRSICRACSEQPRLIKGERLKRSR